MTITYSVDTSLRCSIREMLIKVSHESDVQCYIPCMESFEEVSLIFNSPHLANTMEPLKRVHFGTSGFHPLLSLVERFSLFRGLNCIESTVWGKKSCPLCRTFLNCIINTERPFSEVPLYNNMWPDLRKPGLLAACIIIAMGVFSITGHTL